MSIQYDKYTTIMSILFDIMKYLILFTQCRQNCLFVNKPPTVLNSYEYLLIRVRYLIPLNSNHF